MTKAVILYRIDDGPLRFIGDTGGKIREFPSYADANNYAIEDPWFQDRKAKYKIVELDEL